MLYYDCYSKSYSLVRERGREGLESGCPLWSHYMSPFIRDTTGKHVVPLSSPPSPPLPDVQASEMAAVNKTQREMGVTVIKKCRLQLITKATIKMEREGGLQAS